MSCGERPKNNFLCQGCFKIQNVYVYHENVRYICGFSEIYKFYIIDANTRNVILQEYVFDMDINKLKKYIKNIIFV